MTMATFVQDGKKIRAQVWVDGKRKSKTFITKSEAKTWAALQESTLKVSGNTARITFRQLAQAWVERYTRRPSIEWEARRLTALLAGDLGDTMLPNLNKVVVSKWRDDRLNEVSAGTVLRDWNLLSSVCSDAVSEMGLLDVNPFHGVRRPEPPPPRDRLHTDKEMEALEVASTARPIGGIVLRAFKLACQTGMSAGELCALTHEQINRSTRVAKLPAFKTRPPREVPLNMKAMELLGTGTGPVFDIRPSQLDANWRNLCNAAGVENLHFHDSRHYAATWMAKKIDAVALAKLLGHTNLKMLLNVYYKADAAALVDKLD